jgi:Ca2+-binding EF-hand superfamily protein
MPAAVLSDRELQRMFSYVDADGSGEVDVNELVNFMKEQPPPAKQQSEESKSRLAKQQSEKQSWSSSTITPTNSDYSGGAFGRGNRTPPPPPPSLFIPFCSTTFFIDSFFQHTVDADPRPSPTAVAGMDDFVKQIRCKFQSAAYTHKGVDLEALFRHYDRNNSNAINFTE